MCLQQKTKISYFGGRGYIDTENEIVLPLHENLIQFLKNRGT